MAVITKFVKLPEDLARRLQEQAREKGTSKSDLIREGIARVIREGDGLDMLQLIGEDVGADTGPADLSGNRRHLAGYGRSRDR